MPLIKKSCHVCEYQELKTRQAEKQISQLKNYLLLKPFTILDLYKADLSRSEFTKLLQECIYTTLSFDSLLDILHSPTLMQNISWLIEKKFIENYSEKWINVYLSSANRLHKKTLTYPSREEAMAAIVTINNDTYVGTVKLN